MSDVYSYLWLIPALPFLAAIIIAFFGPTILRDLSHWPCVLAIGASAVLSFFVLTEVNSANPPQLAHRYYTFMQVGPEKRSADFPTMDVAFELRTDALSAIMLMTVTGVGFLIAVFAIGYMKDDPGYPRFFAAVSLFMTAMTLLVSGNNFILLFIGWEGVGLCSYLLIGFWFSKPSAAAAARKAFLVNRVGDFGLMLGIILAWIGSGYYLDYDSVFRSLPRQHPEWVTAVCLLLFCGACGKSAQIPLHVWLPDAMEGPTPVSALIHAATMVTAGVYLVARCTPLFMLAPEAQLVVGCIGCLTALFAALIALTQNDLKRVLAYSTLSQLGYMFLALGSAVNGDNNMVTFAVIAAIFHLFTHAFFKALLFLSAGSVMHAMGGVIDMRKFSGLRTVMPKTHLAFLIGSLALAGVIPFAGFWSKDEILAATLNASSDSQRYGGIYMILFIAGIFTAGLTAFYTFRAYFRTFWGKLVVPPEAGSHGHGGGHGHGHTPKQGVAHESPPVMTVPLMILAVFAVGIGLAVGPTHWFAKLVGKTWPSIPEGEEGMNWALMIGSTLFALAGIALAYLMYVKQPELAGRVAAAAPGAYRLSLNKFYVDELYLAFFMKPVEGFAEFCRIVDQQVVDGLVDTVGEMPRLAGSLFRPVQNGLVQFYALAMMLGLTVFLIALARSL
jgi:NADH-quinone oxidoreductase subunit L